MTNKVTAGCISGTIVTYFCGSGLLGGALAAGEEWKDVHSSNFTRWGLCKSHNMWKYKWFKKNHPCTVVMNLYKSWVWILWRLTHHPLRLCFTCYFHVSTNWQVYVPGQFKSNYPDLRCNHTAELWLLSLAGNYCCKDIYTCAKFHRGDTVASLGAQISPQNHHWNNKAAHGPTFLMKKS